MLRRLSYFAIELPALAIKGLFTFYWFFLALVTVICFLDVLLYLTAWALGRPLLWAR